MSKSKPPFKRGEWVCFGCRVERVRKVEWFENVSDWLVCTDRGSTWADRCRRASTRKLRAESKSLADRAALLAKAADAVEARKETRTRRGNRNAQK